MEEKPGALSPRRESEKHFSITGTKAAETISLSNPFDEKYK